MFIWIVALGVGMLVLLAAGTCVKKDNAFRRVVTYALPARLTFLLSVIAFVLLMAPIIYIGKYDGMSADDYWYSKRVHDYWVSGGRNLLGILGAALEQVKVSYVTWQGTFSSIFLMSLCPSAFGYRGYKLVPAIIICGICLGICSLVWVVMHRWLHAGRSSTLTVAVLTSILAVEKIYSIPQGLTWYNGAMHYMFMQAMALALTACVIRLALVPAGHRGARLGWTLLASFLGIVVGGSNYATIPMEFVLLSGILVGMWYTSRMRRVRICLIPYAVFLAASFVNMAAPGNRIRGAMYQGLGTSPVQAVLESFAAGAQFLVKFTDVFTILMLVLLAPVLWQGLRRVEVRLPDPLFLLLLSFLVVSAGFTSSIYTGAGLYLSRLHNSVRLMYQVLLVMNEGCTIGWIQRRLRRPEGLDIPVQSGSTARDGSGGQIQAAADCAAGTESTGVRTTTGEQKDHNMPVLLLFSLMLLMYCTVRFSSNPLGTFTTFAATYQVEDDALYYQEYLARQELYETSAGKDVVVKPFAHQPWLLYVFDITEDPSNYYNEWTRAYYGLHSVRLDPGAVENTASEP